MGKSESRSESRSEKILQMQESLAEKIIDLVQIELGGSFLEAEEQMSLTMTCLTSLLGSLMATACNSAKQLDGLKDIIIRELSKEMEYAKEALEDDT